MQRKAEKGAQKGIEGRERQREAERGRERQKKAEKAERGREKQRKAEKGREGRQAEGSFIRSVEIESKMEKQSVVIAKTECDLYSNTSWGTASLVYGKQT